MKYHIDWYLQRFTSLQTRAGEDRDIVIFGHAATTIANSFKMLLAYQMRKKKNETLR